MGKKGFLSIRMRNQDKRQKAKGKRQKEKETKSFNNKGTGKKRAEVFNISALRYIIII